MNEFILVLTKFSTIDFLLDQLQEAMNNYKLLGTEEKLRKVEFCCTLCCTKFIMEEKSKDGKDKFDDLMEQSKQFELFKKAFNKEAKN